MTHRDRIPNYPANLINTDQRKGKQARESLVVVQALSRVRLFVGQWTAAHKASLSFTISRSLLKFMSIKSMMPSNCLISCHPLLLPPSVFPSIRVFSNESALSIRWPKDWSVSLSPSNEYSWHCQGNPSVSPFRIFPGTSSTVRPLHTNLHVANFQRC